MDKIKELIANKYYITAVSVLILIMAILLIIPAFGSNNKTPDYSNTNNYTFITDNSEDSSSSESLEAAVKEVMEADTKNDNTLVASVLFNTNSFGEYTTVVEKSGSYKFNAVNVAGGDKDVSWSIYVFDEPYKFGTHHMIRNCTPELITDGSITLYKGQYLYCICSLNLYNYDNSSPAAYLKIRLLNEVDDKLHKTHEHDFKIDTDTSACEKNGYIIYKCSCGETYIEGVKPLEHDYEEEKTEPTCTEDGFTTFKCKKCGNTYTEPGDKATGHTCDAATLHASSSKHEFTCKTCKKHISEAHTMQGNAHITGMTDKNGNVLYYTITINQYCSFCGYTSDSADTEEHIVSSYSYDKSTQTLTFNCRQCGTRTYTCEIHIDYTAAPENDNSSSSSSEDISED